ncbi:hypothetical protein PPGU19_094310 (plasmid) [Paraburkholderia sp. PGU19]|uniref:hypothetical protein n=1 Tax=Paraburkholderia sp. PGU19 TaxID=2735434 RepID=UPI0015DB6381|nr:hypothetical protein [Paraburkholderia sp. PGU19]BCG04863.1 hypothetical protein PPGU19_094310 [Paraburkholderia sp. PGU19]
MKPFCSAPVLVVFIAGCASTWPPANNQTAQQIPAHTSTYIPRANHGATRGDSMSKPPALSVGVSYSDTQLILPWFLTDIINAVNDP